MRKKIKTVKDREVYTNPCVNPKCPNESVVMTQGLSASVYVGKCPLCKQKQLERVQK